MTSLYQMRLIVNLLIAQFVSSNDLSDRVNDIIHKYEYEYDIRGIKNLFRIIQLG